MLAEPGSGVRPFLPSLIHCDAKGRCDIFMAQAGKMPQFYDSGRQRIFAGQLCQRCVQSQEPFIRIGGGAVRELMSLPSPTLFGLLFSPCLLDENSSHGFRCGGKKMPTGIPQLSVLYVYQSYKSFMYQCCRLERLPRLLLCEPCGSQFPQLFINQWQQLLSRRWIAGFDLRQDVGDVGHPAGCNRWLVCGPETVSWQRGQVGQECPTYKINGSKREKRHPCQEAIPGELRPIACLVE